MMNIQRIIPVLALAAVAARAEVKEPGQLVARQCGNLTRSTQVCLADVTDMGKLALEITEMVPGSDDRPLAFSTRLGIVYDSRVFNTMGASTVEYKALVPYQDEASRKIIYKDVTLRVVQVVLRPGANTKASLSINGEPQYGEFGWEDVATTQSLE